MKLKFKRVLCLVLMAIMLLSCLPAQAAEKTVYVTDNMLPVYAAPDASGELLGTMTYGESMTDIGVYTTIGTVWAKVRNSKGQVGYCALSGLDFADPNNLNVKTATKGVTPVFDRPDAFGTVIHTCKKDSRVNVVAITPDGGWYRVKDGSRYGYIESSDLNQIVWINNDVTSSLLSEYGGVDGVVSHGQAYEYLETEERAHQTTVKIRNNKGQVGYIDYYAVTFEDPNTLNEEAYTQVSGQILRKQVNADYGTKYIGKGKAVTVVSMTPSGKTCRVKYDGNYYYISAVLLNPKKNPSGGQVLYARQDVTIYERNTISSDPVAKLSEGQEVKLTGVGSNGTSVRVETASGEKGYQSASAFIPKQPLVQP